MSFYTDEALDSKEKKVRFWFCSDFNESVWQWNSLSGLTDTTNFIFEISDFKEDFEVYLPLFIKKNPNIERLSFVLRHYYLIQDFNKQPLMDALKDKRLLELSMDGLNTSEKIGKIFEMIFECFKEAHIQKIFLNEVFLTKQFLKILVMKDLEVFTLQKCKLDEFSSLDISFSIKFLTIKSLTHESEIGIHKFIQSTKNLENLSLSYNSFLFDFKILKESLKDRYLHSLTIDHQDFQGNEKLIDILKNLSKNLIIKNYQNSEIPIDLFKYLNSSSKIQSFYLYKTPRNLKGIDQYLTNNKNLKILKLDNTLKKDENIRLISNGLSKNNTIEELYLYKTNLQDHMSLLMNSLSCYISSLVLSECNIDELSCDFIQSYLLKNSGLRLLNLELNKISDKGLKTLIKGIRNQRELYELSLSHNKFENEGCIILKDYLKSNMKLNRLFIRYCNCEGDRLKYIIEGLQFNTNLKELHINSEPSNINTQKECFELLFFNTELRILYNTYFADKILIRNQKFIKTLKIEKSYFSNLYFFYQ